MSDYRYVGGELTLFAKAARWKQYMADRLDAFIAGDVLEVGAGIGGTSHFLVNPRVTSWTALEPDAALVEQLRSGLANLPVRHEVRLGTVDDLPSDRRFDAILYIDVLEHIAEDAREVAAAAARLKVGGRLVVLSPAHPWLFSEFDRAVGHERRYTRRRLRAISPPGTHLETLFSLDAAGALLSLGNRLMLRRSVPTEPQIRFWDRRVVPISRCFDPLIGRRFGRSLVAVWRRTGEEATL